MSEMHRHSLANAARPAVRVLRLRHGRIPPCSLRVGAKLIITGKEIDARIDAFPDLNLREKADPGLAERHYHPGRMQLYGIGEFVKKTPPPPDPPFHVRLWRVMPLSVRRQFHPALRRIRRRIIHARRRLRRR